MNNNNLPFVIISAILIAISIALFYFLIIPQFEKISLEEKEILDLEYKLENTTNYFNDVAQNVEKLEAANWEDASKKIDANLMDGPFFVHNMDAYLKGLIVRSGLYLKDLNIAGSSQGSETRTEMQGETGETNTNTNATKEVSVTFDLFGDYVFFRNLLDIFDKQALVIKISSIDIKSGSGSTQSEGGSELGGQAPQTVDPNYLNFQIKVTIPAK